MARPPAGKEVFVALANRRPPWKKMTQSSALLPRLAVLLGILFAACVLGFFVWGIAIGQPKVLMVLPLVAAAFALFFCMLCTYSRDTHPIHTRVHKDDAVLLVNALEVAVEEHQTKKQTPR
jgi:hypothetical protein